MVNNISNGEYFEVFTWQLVQQIFLIVGGLGASLSLLIAVIVFERSQFQERLDFLEGVNQGVDNKRRLSKQKESNINIIADVLDYISDDSEKFMYLTDTDTRLDYYQNEFKAFLIRTEKVISMLPENARVYFVPLLLRITYFDKEDLSKVNLKNYVLELNMEYDKVRKIIDYENEELEKVSKEINEILNSSIKEINDTKKIISDSNKKIF